MECAEARRLIDAGVQPGSIDPLRASLGFHLVRCPACRAYREHPGEAGLLAALLATPAPEPPTAPPPPVSRRLPARPAPPRAIAARPGWPGWRVAVSLLAAVLLIGLVLVMGRIAVAAYTIRGNLAAMRVTAAASPVPNPSLSVPTTPPVPTAAPAATLRAGPPAAPAASVRPAAEPSAIPAQASSAAPPAPSVTPIRLPALGGASLPTLMPTVGVLPASNEPINLLLLGSDRRPGESWQTRSDAIMIVRLDPARQRVALLSLPRDLIVSIPGYGQARINAATVYGELYPELGGGLELARATVSQLLGVPIHHVLRTDFSAFISAVDAIGGVDIVVEQELYDPAYPTMDYGYMVAHFLPGPQHMDGETALIYSRMRHMDSNYARNRRQQQVILAIIQRVREQNILGQVEMLADLSSALRDNIQTDLSLNQMLGLAWAFRNYSPDLVERYALDENLVYEGGISDDPYATLPVPGAVPMLVDQLVNGPQS